LNYGGVNFGGLDGAEEVCGGLNYGGVNFGGLDGAEVVSGGLKTYYLFLLTPGI
jgi:hypothetical protein